MRTDRSRHGSGRRPIAAAHGAAAGTYDRWLQSLGRSNAGWATRAARPFPSSTAPPVQPLCRSVCIPEPPFCPNGRSWVVENPFIYHQHYANKFSGTPRSRKSDPSSSSSPPSRRPCLWFVRELGFQQPALCSNDKDGQARRRLQESAVSRTTANPQRPGHQEEEEEEEEEGERRARRRLGLSEDPTGYTLGPDAMWILHFFGGFSTMQLG